MGGKKTSELPAWLYSETNCKTNMDTIIHICDSAFQNPVTERAVYPELLEKIYRKAKFFVAYDTEILGYCAF